ncbi:MAG: hypothetical protein GKC04_08685 [Methanomicrobiales archaeon]|nr:hypothetical protein [Methanomicrobiales archaeon]
MTAPDRDDGGNDAARRFCEAAGLMMGTAIDIRDLIKTAKRHNIDVFLYWEEGLAREEHLERDLERYADIPEENRPFIHIDAFTRFFSETYAAFPMSPDELFASIPLMITLISCGTRSAGRKQVPYVTGLMPFLDEMDVDS